KFSDPFRVISKLRELVLPEYLNRFDDIGWFQLRTFPRGIKNNWRKRHFALNREALNHGDNGLNLNLHNRANPQDMICNALMILYHLLGNRLDAQRITDTFNYRRLPRY